MCADLGTAGMGGRCTQANGIFISPAYLRIMGLVYTTGYVDFEEPDWNQVSVDPPEFEALADKVTLDVFDVSQKSYRLRFRKGARIKCLRMVGKYRLSWDDSVLFDKS